MDDCKLGCITNLGKKTHIYTNTHKHSHSFFVKPCALETYLKLVEFGQLGFGFH